MAKVLIFTLITILSLLARAEYRAYRLSITKDGSSREVITNYDNYQYVGVYPLNAGESIEYVNSWMCWSRGGEDTPICPDPDSPQPTSGTSLREPAAAP